MITNTQYADHNDFASFLAMPKTARELDLSNATIIDCIYAKIKIKSRTSPRYGKQFSSLIKSITFLEESYNCKLYPSKVSSVFWSYFIPLMQTRYNSINTVRTICSQLKALMSWSSQYGAEISPSYNDCDMPSITLKQIALTADDVSRIYHFDIDSIDRRPQIKRTLHRVRDMFCLMCNLGLRYSDAKRLTKDHFENNVVRVLQQKTKRYAHIDVPNMCIHRDMVYSILEKYEYKASYACDNSEFDKRLHELMEYCHFDDVIQYETIEKGEVVTKKRKKHEMITSHSARRTFVVYNAIRGKSALEIMRATGHKTFSAFQKYLCYND